MSSDSKTHIKVCHGRACEGRLSKYTLQRAEAETADREDILCDPCPCQGNCEDGTTVMIEKGGKSEQHSQVDPIKMAKLIKSL